MHASAQFMKTYGLDKSVIGAFGWVKKFRVIGVIGHGNIDHYSASLKNQHVLKPLTRKRGTPERIFYLLWHQDNTWAVPIL